MRNAGSAAAGQIRHSDDGSPAASCANLTHRFKPENGYRMASRPRWQAFGSFEIDKYEQELEISCRSISSKR